MVVGCGTQWDMEPSWRMAGEGTVSRGGDEVPGVVGLLWGIYPSISEKGSVKYWLPVFLQLGSEDSLAPGLRWTHMLVLINSCSFDWRRPAKWCVFALGRKCKWLHPKTSKSDTLGAPCLGGLQCPCRGTEPDGAVVVPKSMF